MKNYTLQNIVREVKEICLITSLAPQESFDIIDSINTAQMLINYAYGEKYPVRQMNQPCDESMLPYHDHQCLIIYGVLSWCNRRKAQFPQLEVVADFYQEEWDRLINGINQETACNITKVCYA